MTCKWKTLVGGRKGRAAGGAWCGVGLCNGAVGACQCAGLCSLGKRRVVDGCRQRLVFKIIATCYRSEKQLWHGHFCYRRRGGGWGTDPRKEGCHPRKEGCLVVPHQAPQPAQPSPAQPHRWRGPVELGAHATHPAVEILILSHRTQPLPRVLLPQQTLATTARSPTCPPASSMLCCCLHSQPPLALLSVFHPINLSSDHSFGFFVYYLYFFLCD